jgi:hypothetical protein
MSFADRCYVIYGTGFRALKIKGLANKKALMESLRADGFHPQSSRLNPRSPSGQRCTERPTPY